MTDTMGKYRLRTWLRGHLPTAFMGLFPKGLEDCGAHEWYRADIETWRCYHCEAGVTHASPWSPIEHGRLALVALEESLRLDAERAPGPETIAEEQRLFDELAWGLRVREAELRERDLA